ncbi:S-adenosylmethionine:tRNA ribosyltransferase-isomerase [Bacteroidales bacterium]
MNEIRSVSIEDYDYPLQEHQIAKYPVADRTQSKLLIYRNSELAQDTFSNIGTHLPEGALLVLNQTKVIKARLLFKKTNGVPIEIFCLEPLDESFNHGYPMAAGSPVRWKCLVGNSKRWKEGPLEMALSTEGKAIILRALRIEKADSHSVIDFRWNNERFSFGDLISLAGELPLPPYLHRNAEASDLVRYQTVFACEEGSVAAPTAGLHFDDRLIAQLSVAGFSFSSLTLHVGAGTFRPVASPTIGLHEMHSEKIVITSRTIDSLLSHLQKPIIPVGTTSMRSIESLYWIGVLLLTRSGRFLDFHIDQWLPYSPDIQDISPSTALEAVQNHLKQYGLSQIEASTSLMIAPGYRFRLASGLITNFHQPKSTLLLLVSALVGTDWRRAYDYAAQHYFRFLSYGDSCLFLPNQKTL